MTRSTVRGMSVVIICRDEADYIPECLRSLERALTGTVVPVEILLVDGGSDDQTVALARQWAAERPAGPLLRVVAAGSAGYAHQRNLGVRAARHTWIAFLSADVRVRPDWLHSAIASINETPDLAIGRFDLAAPAGRRDWLASLARTVYPSRCDEPWVERCSTVHLIAPRDLLLRHPFDERLVGCEDKDFAYRVRTSPAWRGGAILAARPRHLARESAPGFLRKVYRESRDLMLISRLHGRAFPDCFGWRAHARRAALLAALALPAAIAAAAVAGGPYAALVCGAAGLGAGWYPAGWRQRGPFPAVRLAMLHIAAMWMVNMGWVIGHWRPAIAGDDHNVGRRARTGHLPCTPHETPRSAHA